jgi:hypothetical protein
MRQEGGAQAGQHGVVGLDRGHRRASAWAVGTRQAQPGRRPAARCRRRSRPPRSPPWCRSGRALAQRVRKRREGRARPRRARRSA